MNISKHNFRSVLKLALANFLFGSQYQKVLLVPFEYSSHNLPLYFMYIKLISMSFREHYVCMYVCMYVYIYMIAGIKFEMSSFSG